MMAAGFSVQIEDLRAAAATFTQLRDAAAGLLRTGALAGTDGMAGRDPVLAAWRARYDAVAAAQWAATNTAAVTLGAIATKLTDTADAYLAAEHTASSNVTGRTPNESATAPETPSAAADATARPGTPPRDVGGPADRAGPAPPSSTGPRGPQVPDVLAGYYPGGDPAVMRAAASAWSALADGMDRIAYEGDAAFRRLVAGNGGAAFSAMRTYWEQRFTACAADPLLNAVVNGAGTLRDSCAALADLIERTRAAVRGAAAEAAGDMSPLDLPAELLGEFAWGVPELELLVGTGALAVSYLRDYSNAYLYALDHLVARLSPEEEQRLRRAAASPSSDGPVGAGLADVGRISGLELTGTVWDTAGGPHPTPDMVHATPERITHILRGDGRGGGHAPGAGIPGKSEFPPTWGEPEIVAAMLSVARDPEQIDRSAIPGRWVATGVQGGVRIRVIVDDSGSVVTAVPLAGPGVVRNTK